jgi:chromosome partitioning protein
MVMRKIAFVNQKGGVGKTTSAVNIGAGLTRLKKKVLMIDLDPQANLTYSLGFEADDARSNIYDYLKGVASYADVVQEKDGYKAIASHISLAGADLEFSVAPGREMILQERIGEDVDDIDYLLIDCPPSLGLLTLNALCAAIEVFIPIQTEYLALQGVKQLMDTVDKVQKRVNPHLQITGVIATRYDGRKLLNREVVDILKDQFKESLFKTVIRENISLAEAPSWGKTIYDYRPKSYGADDYMKLCKEIIGRR